GSVRADLQCSPSGARDRVHSDADLDLRYRRDLQDPHRREGGVLRDRARDVRRRAEHFLSGARSRAAVQARSHRVRASRDRAGCAAGSAHRHSARSRTCVGRARGGGVVCRGHRHRPDDGGGPADVSLGCRVPRRDRDRSRRLRVRSWSATAASGAHAVAGGAAAMKAPLTRAARIRSGVIAVVTLLVAYEAMARTSDAFSYAFVPLEQLLGALVEISRSGELLDNIAASLKVVLQGVAFGGGAGLLIGAAMAYSKPIAAFVNPLLNAWRPIPPLGLSPPIGLWVGIGRAS